MDDDRRGSPTAEEPVGRPFLYGPAGPGLPSATAAADIRPYLLTGGRTEVDNPAIAMETVVVAAGPAARPVPGSGTARPQPWERDAIIALCQRPLSVAEVAVHQRLPLGVARVLVADLVAAGVLLASSSAAHPQLAQLTQDVAFVERLIAGVAAL